MNGEWHGYVSTPNILEHFEKKQRRNYCSTSCNLFGCACSCRAFAHCGSVLENTSSECQTTPLTLCKKWCFLPFFSLLSDVFRSKSASKHWSIKAFASNLFKNTAICFSALKYSQTQVSNIWLFLQNLFCDGEVPYT